MTTPRHTLGTRPPPELKMLRRPVLRSGSARGDAAAFAALYQRHHQELYRYCRAILRDDDDAQDALQSAMAKAFAALQHESRDFELRPWLFRIARNEAISILRRRPDAAHLDAVPEPSVDSLPGTVADRQRLADLRADLADLPERQRSALVLRELSGLGHEEIAQVLSSSARAVKQSIFEARSGLAECAEGREMACEAVQRALSDADGRVLRGRRIRAHLRGCRACRQFRAAMETRPADLQALASPLPVGAGAAVLAAVLPGGGATVAGGTGTGAAAAGSATAGGALAGAGSSVAGGALTGLATKAAIVAAVGAAAVGAATIQSASSGPKPAASPPAVRSTTAARLGPAPLGAATVARRSGTPAAATAHPAAPGRARHGTAAHPSHRGRSAAAPGRQRAASAHRRNASAQGARAHGAGAAKVKHAGHPAHPAHPARPARAASPGRRVQPQRAAAVPRPRPSRPAASQASRHPVDRVAGAPRDPARPRAEGRRGAHAGAGESRAGRLAARAREVAPDPGTPPALFSLDPEPSIREDTPTMHRKPLIAAVAIALLALPSLAAATGRPPSPGNSEQAHARQPATAQADPPGPNAPAATKAKAYGRFCQGESKTHVAGQKGTPFSQCVTAMARLATGETTNPARACKALSKKHVKGQKGTPYSRCVAAAAKLRGRG